MHFFDREDVIQYFGSLQSRELGQAPMLLVFLTPRQALSGLWTSILLNDLPGQRDTQSSGKAIQKRRFLTVILQICN